MSVSIQHERVMGKQDLLLPLMSNEWPVWQTCSCNCLMLLMIGLYSASQHVAHGAVQREADP